MSWIASNWRLKLLALALTVGLLGAVAFSENPIEFKTIPAHVAYEGLPTGLALRDPVTTVGVQVSGLTHSVDSVKPENIEVRADVSKLRANADTTVNARIRVLVPGITATDSSQAIHVVTDSIQTRNLDIEVRTPNQASGWKVDPDPKRTHASCQPDPSLPCKVTLTGPTSLIQDVKAYVDIPQQINNNVTSIPSQPVRFERSGQPVDFTKVSTYPQVGWDPAIVGVQIAASSSSAQRAVAVNVPVTGRPACGFGVTGLTINPGNGIVQITGPADIVTGRDSVSVDSVDISNANANVVKDLAVRVPDQVTAQPAVVRVTVQIQKQLDCAAPTPTPTPSPAPTKTP